MILTDDIMCNLLHITRRNVIGRHNIIHLYTLYNVCGICFFLVICLPPFAVFSSFACYNLYLYLSRFTVFVMDILNHATNIVWYLCVM